MNCWRDIARATLVVWITAGLCCALSAQAPGPEQARNSTQTPNAVRAPIPANLPPAYATSSLPGMNAPTPRLIAGTSAAVENGAPLISGRLDPSVRVKDITFVEGDRINHVSGEGLVFGLSGTGGKAEQTILMAANYFLRKGLQIQNVNTKNMSAVLVSGKIPAYARKGETILVTVSVADDATSLRGGTLHQTALRGIDDEIYAIAQGPIVGGGVSAQGDAASVQKNHPTVGVCEAIVEREIGCEQIVRNGRIRLVLRNKAYSTATQIANALNDVFPYHARALDSGTVEIAVPRTFQRGLPTFISMIGNLRVRPDTPARVVINQKTGTIVLGHHVKISRVVFASENIVIATNETPVASQPAPFSQGETTVLPRTSVDVVESGGTYNLWRGGLTVGDLANALNTLAVSPNTLINIMTSLRNQGALQAELIIE
ncbi:MAG: flagellar basal body P-ring protein FlgI [Pirellulaceae bacterium]|nr:flagellar basal body P-ring protein FlgI [Pirellulaceae bacterium]